MHWPWVSRRRFNVLTSQVQHLTDVRLDNVGRLARAAMEIHQLTKSLDTMRADRDRWHADRDRWRAEYTRVAE